MQSTSPVIAMWDVAGETYKAMSDETRSDFDILFNGYEYKDQLVFEVINCEPLEFEDSRVIRWKGKAIVTYLG